MKISKSLLSNLSITQIYKFERSFLGHVWVSLRVVVSMKYDVWVWAVLTLCQCPCTLIVILSFCNIVKGQAIYDIVTWFRKESMVEISIEFIFRHAIRSMCNSVYTHTLRVHITCQDDGVVVCTKAHLPLLCYTLTNV